MQKKIHFFSFFFFIFSYIWKFSTRIGSNVFASLWKFTDRKRYNLCKFSGKSCASSGICFIFYSSSFLSSLVKVIVMVICSISLCISKTIVSYFHEAEMRNEQIHIQRHMSCEPILASDKIFRQKWWQIWINKMCTCNSKREFIKHIKMLGKWVCKHRENIGVGRIHTFVFRSLFSLIHTRMSRLSWIFRNT